MLLTGGVGGLAGVGRSGNAGDRLAQACQGDQGGMGVGTLVCLLTMMAELTMFETDLWWNSWTKTSRREREKSVNSRLLNQVKGQHFSSEMVLIIFCRERHAAPVKVGRRFTC